MYGGRREELKPLSSLLHDPLIHVEALCGYHLHFKKRCLYVKNIVQFGPDFYYAQEYYFSLHIGYWFFGA